MSTLPHRFCLSSSVGTSPVRLSARYVPRLGPRRGVRPRTAGCVSAIGGQGSGHQTRGPARRPHAPHCARERATAKRKACWACYAVVRSSVALAPCAQSVALTPCALTQPVALAPCALTQPVALAPRLVTASRACALRSVCRDCAARSVSNLAGAWRLDTTGRACALRSVSRDCAARSVSNLAAAWRLRRRV